MPTMRTPVDLDGAHKALRLIEALEDSDDVQNVYSNLDIPDDVAASSRTPRNPADGAAAPVGTAPSSRGADMTTCACSASTRA